MCGRRIEAWVRDECWPKRLSPKAAQPATGACGWIHCLRWWVPWRCIESSAFATSLRTGTILSQERCISNWSSIGLPVKPESLVFLKSLLDTPGPSAFEAGPARVWRTEAEKFSDDVHSDVSGNSFATINADATPRLMFAGHIDEIGVMVTHIDDEGYLSFDTIGGWDHQVFVGQRVILLGRSGQITGVVGKKAIHQMEREEREKVSKVEDLWIDIGAATRAEAEAHIRIGDPGVLSAGVLEFPNGRLVSRCIDNRIGAFVVLEALRLLSDDPAPAGASVTAVATTREEIAATGGGARSSASV